MNTRPSRPTAPGPVADRDWQAQEQALASPGHRADALLARALRSQPLPEPPPGFAGQFGDEFAFRRIGSIHGEDLAGPCVAAARAGGWTPSL